MPCSGRIALAATALAIAGCADEPRETTLLAAAESGRDRTLPERFEAIAEAAVAQGRVVGVQYALIEGGRTLAVDAFGAADRESGRPMSADTPINVASISKSITAWGVAAWLETAPVSADTPVNDLVTGYRLESPSFDPSRVTLRRLLSHTAGLSTPSVPVFRLTEALPPVPGILRGEAGVPRARLVAEAGAGFRYSGAGFLLLQLLLEEQTDSAFSHYMRDTVLDPAGMESSSFDATDYATEAVAVYYRADGRRREPYHLRGAAGGLYSTASDMASYLRLYTGDGARDDIVSAAAFETMLSPVASVRGDGVHGGELRYAWGHYVYSTPEGQTIVFHTGGNPGLRTMFLVAPRLGAGFFAAVNDDRGEVIDAMMQTWGSEYRLTLHDPFD